MAKADITGRLNLDSTGFERGIQRSKRSVKGFAKSSMETFVRMGTAFAGIGLVKSIVGLGTSAAETADKFDAVFGRAADRMNERISELQKTIPASRMEMQNALATFGQMAKSFGLNSEAAQDFSINMLKVSGDLASFHDMRPEEVFIKMRSAISGEFEPLKQLGIIINEATLKQEAMNMGIWDGVGALSASQKAMAVQSLVINQMGAASGNAAMTANSAANQIKFLQAKLKDTGAEIGQTMLPAITGLANGLLAVVNGAKAASEAVGAFVAKEIFGDTKEDPLAGFRESAEQKLRREDRLDKTGGRGGVQKRLAQIEAEAKLLKASYEARVKTNAEESKLAETSEEVSETQRLINEANEDLKNSLTAQVKAQGEFKSQQELVKKDAEALASKKKEILMAELQGNKELVATLTAQLEKEKHIQDLMKDLNIDRAEAIKLEAIIANQKDQQVEAVDTLIDKEKELQDEKRKTIQIGTKGLDQQDLSTEKLEFLAEKYKKQIRDLKRQDSVGAFSIGTKLIQATVQRDLSRIEEELMKRQKFQSLAGSRAQSIVFDPFERERLQSSIEPPANKETIDLLRDIKTGISGINSVTSKLDRTLQ